MLDSSESPSLSSYVPTINICGWSALNAIQQGLRSSVCARRSLVFIIAGTGMLLLRDHDFGIQNENQKGREYLTDKEEQ